MNFFFSSRRRHTFFFQAEDGIRDRSPSRGLGDVYKRQRQKKAGDGEGETVVQDYDDDGETAAGGRLLHVMQLMDVWNVVVVVTRWYGGIQLGPARFRLINDVGRDALVKGGFTKEKEEASGAEKGKKKGKK